MIFVLFGTKIKELFFGFIERLKGILNTISNFFKRIIPGGSSGGKSKSSGDLTDFISRPGQAPASFSPQDTIIGVKDPTKLGSTNITINNPVIRDGSDITKLANEVSRVLQRQVNSRVSSNG